MGSPTAFELQDDIDDLVLYDHGAVSDQRRLLGALSSLKLKCHIADTQESECEAIDPRPFQTTTTTTTTTTVQRAEWKRPDPTWQETVSEWLPWKHGWKG